jgi:hypothetical protein
MSVHPTVTYKVRLEDNFNIELKPPRLYVLQLQNLKTSFFIKPWLVEKCELIVSARSLLS